MHTFLPTYTTYIWGVFISWLNGTFEYKLKLIGLMASLKKKSSIASITVNQILLNFIDLHLREKRFCV